MARDCAFFFWLECVLQRSLTTFSKPIHAYILQVIILANHMNGKDTHVRGMRILGPIE